jgi:hypothetical protein
VEWLYNEFFQLVWHAGIAYIRIGLESVGDFDLEWSKELSKLVGNSGKYEVGIAAFRTIS